MLNTRRAKLFKNGASQAVRLPSEFRFESTDVYISRDNETGDIILSSHPVAKSWKTFFDLLRNIDVPSDFMNERPMNVKPFDRDLFKA